MKKNIKHLFISAALIATLSVVVIACSENTEPVSNESNKNISFNTKNVNPAYLTQIPFVVGGDTESDMDFLSDNEVYQKMEDSAVDWTYFDNLNNSSLSTSLRQELSYIVLCKKDLIGLVNKNPNNTTLKEALRRNVDNLIETKYIGYTSLYSGLETLRSIGDNVGDRATEILQYAADDQFHLEMIGAGPEEVGSKDLYDKFVDNYSYMQKIAEFK